jgi:hypothetical protein
MPDEPAAPFYDYPPPQSIADGGGNDPLYDFDDWELGSDARARIEETDEETVEEIVREHLRMAFEDARTGYWDCVHAGVVWVWDWDTQPLYVTITAAQFETAVMTFLDWHGLRNPAGVAPVDEETMAEIRMLYTGLIVPFRAAAQRLEAELRRILTLPTRPREPLPRI